MKKMEPKAGESAEALVARMPSPAPIDEIYLKTKDSLKAKEKKEDEAKVVPAASNMWIKLTIGGFVLLLLLVLASPGLVLAWYIGRYNRTSAAADDLCVALHLPHPAPRSSSAYVRLEYRRAMEIAVVGAGAAVALADDGTVASLSVALTAVAPVILAVHGLDALVGRPVDDELLAAVADAASTQATPITDLRATDRYRRHTIGVMARRAVHAAARRAAGEAIAIPVNRALGIGAAS
jgi:hypothetical protein